MSLAKQLLSLLQELPQLSGLDFDVEVQNPDWLNLAKLVLMLRTAIGSRGGEMPVMTMTFHALSAAMKGFAPLMLGHRMFVHHPNHSSLEELSRRFLRPSLGTAPRTLKPQDSEEKRFVDLFDMCHAMTYTVMDQQGRHASEKMDTDVVEAWAKLGLPAERLTLGWKHVFQRIGDSRGVSMDHLEPAARELAIRCSKNSLKKVFKLVDKENVGSINFDQFNQLMTMVSDPEKVKTVLSPAAAPYLDYRSSVDQDPAFSKHFPIPRPLQPTMRYTRQLNASVEAIRWVADDTYLAATGEHLILYEVNGSEDPTKRCHVGPSVYCMDAFVGGPGVLLGYGKKGDNLCLWDMAEEAPKLNFQGPSPVYSCCLTRELALSGNKEGLVAMHDLQTGKCIQTWQVHESLVTSISLASDGNKVCTTSRDGQVVIFDINAGSMPSCVISKIPDAAAGYTVSDALWCGEDEILSAGDDYCVKMWATWMGNRRRSLALSPDGALFASGAADSSVRLWALKPYGLRALEDFVRDVRSAGLVSGSLSRGPPSVSKAVQIEESPEDLVDSKGYIRSLLGLTGHSLTVSCLAWHRGPDEKHRLLSGAHDDARRGGWKLRGVTLHCQEGFFFVNAASAAKKVQLAEERGIAGLMIWELGQDVLEDHGNILREVWNAAKNKGFLHRLLGFSFKEDHLFSFLTVLMGGYYFLKVMQLAMKPSPKPLKQFSEAAFLDDAENFDVPKRRPTEGAAPVACPKQWHRWGGEMGLT
eukprot:g31335.t1